MGRHVRRLELRTRRARTHREGYRSGDAEGAVKRLDQRLRELGKHLMRVSPGDEKSLVKFGG